MLSAFTDPTVWEGLLMFVDLRNLIDNEEGWDDYVGWKFKENWRGKLACKHSSFIINNHDFLKIITIE